MTNDLIDREKLLKELKISADHHEENSRDYVLMLRDRNIVREQPTVNAIPLPDNATNGEVMEMIFPHAEIEDTGDCIAISIDDESVFCINFTAIEEDLAKAEGI